MTKDIPQVFLRETEDTAEDWAIDSSGLNGTFIFGIIALLVVIVSLIYMLI